MTIPYQTATSGARALEHIHKTLQAFGCTKFGHMTDSERGEVLVQFEYRSMPVSVRASINGYAAAMLKRKPYTHRMRQSRADYERSVKEQATISVYSVLRDWIKGQVTAVETGILSFEGAFLGQIMLPSGQTVLEAAQEQKMLPATEEKVVQIGGQR